MKTQLPYEGICRKQLVRHCLSVMSSGDLNLALKHVYFPSETTILFGQGLAGAGAAGRNSWALGRLGADAAPRLWAWGKVGRGQPQNSEVVQGSEREL